MIGIITFHGSHNHGSMLQAYATQQALLKLGYKNEIINFRMKSQKEYYALYQTKFGMMRFVRNLLLLPIHSSRSKRERKFEKFLHEKYILSGNELETYEDLKTVASKYDIYLSGSDQIWSNRIPELVGSKIDYKGVYFLDFVAPGKKKVSYASSIGEATLEELEDKKNLLMQYKSIATREKTGALVLSKLLGKKIPTVIDPTLLLNKDDWRKISGERIISEKYIFLYTLRGIRPGRKWAKYLKPLGERLGYKVVCVSPFFPVISKGIECLVNVGPENFVNLIDNAELVFTDSFHGTAFSINLGKNFFSLTKAGSRDVRKIDLMKSVGLNDRLLTDISDIDKIREFNMDYLEPQSKLDRLRKESYAYLSSALK